MSCPLANKIKSFKKCLPLLGFFVLKTGAICMKLFVIFDRAKKNSTVDIYQLLCMLLCTLSTYVYHHILRQKV